MKLQELPAGSNVTWRDFNDLLRLVLRIRPRPGAGTIVQEGQGGTVVSTVAPRDSGFWAKIGSSPSEDGSNKRYRYAWTEVEQTAGGANAWTWSDKDGGRSGTTSTDPARNTYEVPNGSAGTLGNGVAVASLVGTFDLKACPSGVVVWMRVVSILGGGVAYWFSYANGVDGSCP